MKTKLARIEPIVMHSDQTDNNIGLFALVLIILAQKNTITATSIKKKRYLKRGVKFKTYKTQKSQKK